ncbi:MAG: membrane protein insertase YidC, partial [Cyclobacteriaceae bacterium]|nr:membrane protein insertase YidC [Cyclobacteriaceae bacterium]
MDKNQAIGFVLMAALLMVYFYFFAPKPTEQPSGVVVDTVTTINTQPQQLSQNNSIIQEKEREKTAIVIDSADLSDDKFGIFTSVLLGDEKNITIENELISIKYSTKGGLARQVALKNYDDFQFRDQLILFDEESSRLKYMISTEYGNINLGDLYFKAEQRNNGDTTELVFTADLGNNKYIKHIYGLAPNSYAVSHQFLISGLENEISGGKVSMLWDNYLKRLESNLEYSRNYTTINYWLSSGSMDELSQRSSDKQEETFTEPVNWFSFKQRFFTTGYIFNKPIRTGYISSEFNELDTITSKYCK